MKYNKIPVIASIAMLLLAIPSGWPYGYYTLLRLVVCGTAIYMAVNAKMASKDNWMWGLGFIALLFNPLIPIHLDKGIWMVVDLLVAGIFIVLLFSKKQ